MNTIKTTVSDKMYEALLNARADQHKTINDIVEAALQEYMAKHYPDQEV